MSILENVTVVKAANIYFEGKVSSRSITLADGSAISLGVMLPGDYEFSTEKKELMEIQSGELDIQLAGDENWQSISAGESFEVAANSSFKLRVQSITDYCCSYLD